MSNLRVGSRVATNAPVPERGLSKKGLPGSIIKGPWTCRYSWAWLVDFDEPDIMPRWVNQKWLVSPVACIA